MERRLVLTGALALIAAPAVVATPGLAQSSPAPPTDAPAAAPAVPAASALPPAPAMKMAAPLSMSDASTAHLKDTLAAGAVSLLTSRIAAARVEHPALKQFVSFEIAEQETIADILKAMMMPGAPPVGAVRPPTDAELMGNLDPKGKAVVTKLHETKATKAFERDYVKAQIEGHTALLAIQDTYLKTPDTLDETNVAKLARGMITEHLALLGGIEKMLG